MKNQSIFYVTISIFSVVLLSGCGNKVDDFVSKFSCSRNDFRTISFALDEVGQPDPSREGRVYTQVKELNAKLAQCPTAVLKACSPRHMKVSNGDSIEGPVNAFGVSSKVTIEWISGYVNGEVWVKNESAVWHYSTEVTDWKAFHKTLACFWGNASYTSRN